MIRVGFAACASERAFTTHPAPFRAYIPHRPRGAKPSPRRGITMMRGKFSGRDAFMTGRDDAGVICAGKEINGGGKNPIQRGVQPALRAYGLGKAGAGLEHGVPFIPAAHPWAFFFCAIRGTGERAPVLYDADGASEESGLKENGDGRIVCRGDAVPRTAGHGAGVPRRARQWSRSIRGGSLPHGVGENGLDLARVLIRDSEPELGFDDGIPLVLTSPVNQRLMAVFLEYLHRLDGDLLNIQLEKLIDGWAKEAVRKCCFDVFHGGTYSHRNATVLEHGC
jgi:hypothetical protein